MTQRRKCRPGCQCGRHTHIVTTRHAKRCEECGEAFTAKRVDARFCSATCNKTNYEREHRDTIRAAQARYQRNHREQTRERQRKYEERHGERVRAEKRQRYADISADPEKAAERREVAHQYYLANRDRILAQKREKKQEYNGYRRRSEHGEDLAVIFDELWKAQNGKCYLCGDPLDREKSRAIHLDHDHRCCSYARSCERCRRGLACDGCNRLIGLARDDPNRLRLIADNLERANAAVTLRMQQSRQLRERRTYKHTCTTCGEPFTAYRPDAMFCSSICYERSHYDRRKREHRAPEVRPVTEMA